MISLKKYLDTVQSDPVKTDSVQTGPTQTGSKVNCEPEGKELLPVAISAYRSALLEMGNCSLDACPALGKGLKQGMGKLEASLAAGITWEAIEAAEKGVQEQLQDWGRLTARHYRQKAGEVKEILIVMARTAESVGARDQRCARQISEVTTRLKTIANLEDLTEIRASIELSASELKSSIDRMAAEGKAAIDQLHAEVASFQVKLDEAEQMVSRDSLTGLGSRLSVEGKIEQRIAAGLAFCVAMIDIDCFKKVNDDHGHLVGDELLQQFAKELKSACRATDIAGRWGGDEFIILLDCGKQLAKGQIDRLKEWVCGNYTVHGDCGPMNLRVDASIGLGEFIDGDTLKTLVGRADAEMYQHKAASRAKGNIAKR